MSKEKKLVAPPAGSACSPISRVLDEWARERPDLDMTPITVFSLLYISGRRIERFYEASVAPFGFSAADFFLLCELRRQGPPYRLAPTALFRAMVRTSGGMTKQLDNLQSLGLIRRIANPNDRRSLLVELTRKGEKQIDRALEAHIANETRVLEGISVTDRERLAQLLDRIISALN